MIQAMHAVAGLWVFALGTVVGSFANVCIYRIPWEKSVLWPGSHCPKCLSPILARDNVPVLGWIMLRGACRRCGLPIAARYPLIEMLMGALFVATYLVDVASDPFGALNTADFARLGYHLALVSLLVIATFIDYDLFVIPDAVTVPGMAFALVVGALAPWIRPEPAGADTMIGGLASGLIGWLVGGLLVWAVRLAAGVVFRREAMGFGDVTLLATIGAFLGWQAAVLTFFLAPFFGIGVALWKLARIAGKWLTGSKTTAADHEMPFGPYLSMAALTLVLSWPWLWNGWAKGFFTLLVEVVRFLVQGG
jgi:leader peptidase (prepilin peptidase)/N-methyltransferase